MTNRYVDTSLGATTATYDPTAASGSRDTGGSDAGYQNVGDALTASANGDTMILRGGQSHTESVLRAISLTGFTIENYTGEHVTLDITDNAFQFQPASNGVTVNGKVGDGSFTWSSSNAVVVEACIYQYASDTVINDVDFVSTGGSYCVRHRLPTATGITYNRCTFKQLVNSVTVGMDNGTSGAAGSVSFNGCINEGQILVLKTIDVTYNNGIIRPPTTSNSPGMLLSDAGASITVNNSIGFGSGMQGDPGQGIFYRVVYGTFVVNNSIINGNLYDPDYYSAGTITFNDCLYDQAVFFDDYAYTGLDLIACIIARDGTFFSSTGAERSDEFLTMLSTRNANMTACPDDTHFIAGSSAIQSRITAWDAAGHEMGNSGYSADNKSYDYAFTATYSGAGANPRVEISSNGTSVALVTDSGTDATFDTSRSFSGDGVIGASVASGNLANSIHSVANWACTLALSTFDDTLSYTLADGSYSAVSGSEENVDFDPTRRWNEEINVSAAEINAYTTTDVTTQMAVAGGANAAYKAAAAAYGITQFMTSMDNNNIIPISSADNNALLGFNGSSHSFGGTLSQADLEAQARIIVTELSYKKGIAIFMLPVPGVAGNWTATQAGYFIDELLSHGVRVMNVRDAAAYIAANQSSYSETTRPSGVQSSGSAGIAAGKRWWTGANPVGKSGEPFSDFDTDIGPSQSTHGPFHPVNL